MKRQMLIFLTIIIFSIPIYSSEKNIEDKINALNKNTFKSLGISLTALSYLMTVSPTQYMPLWYLKESGNIEHIKELEKAGYVKVTILKGLPDGTMLKEEQVNIIPLHTGIEIKRCLSELKHNKSIKKDI